MAKDFQKRDRDERRDQRAQNKKAVMIKNSIDDIHQIERGTIKEKTKLQCKCFHCDQNGNPAIFKHPSATSEVTGNPLFVCRICNKYLDIYDVREEDFNEAVDRIDRVCDVIKIRLNVTDRSSESDIKLYNRVWKTQMFVTGKFRDLFKATKKRNNKKKSSGGGSSNFTVANPSR